MTTLKNIGLVVFFLYDMAINAIAFLFGLLIILLHIQVWHVFAGIVLILLALRTFLRYRDDWKIALRELKKESKINMK